MTSTTLALIAAASFLCSLYLCVFARDFALRRALLDQPNERSLHSTPVPRLGGVAIVIATYAVMFLALSAYEDEHHLWPWLVSALPLAGLGLLDDLRPLSAGTRFMIQIGVAVLFCAAMPMPEALGLWPGTAALFPGMLILAGGAVFLIAMLNIYNFMDGMDGLAATQSVGASFALASCALAYGHEDLAMLSLALLGASGGFFIHNSPPAKLFMGDVGSTFLGFSFAAITLLGVTATEDAFAVTPIAFALAPFLCDGTFTLLRRLFRGEKIWEAHRTHLYQRAVATGLQHHDVLVRYAAWTAFGVVTSAADIQTVGRYTWLFALCHIACYLAIWRWVRVRERARDQASAQTPESRPGQTLRLEHH